MRFPWSPLSWQNRTSMCGLPKRLAMRPWGLALVVSCLLLVSPLQATEHWTYGASDHFEVYTTGGEKRARAALAYFERVHAFFADVLRLSPQQTRPTRLIVFSSAREYKPYRFNEVATAYYRPGPDRDYIVMQGLDAESYPVVVHEYAHLIIRYSGNVFPIWLNEGLAEFFSTIQPQGGKMALGRVPRGRLEELRSSGRLFDLPRLFAVAHDSPEYNNSRHAGLFYAESWALTHMVFTSAPYRARSGQLLAAVAGGATSAAAFQSVYGKSVDEVFDDLQVYVRATTFQYFTADYRDPKPASSFTVRAAEPFEAGLVKATLLAEGGPQAGPAAREALDALARDRPDDLALLETRAYFELRQRHVEAARTAMARAVELGSTNARLYRDYATIVQAPGERAALLAEAVRLDPGDLELRLQYALDLAWTRHYDEALTQLASITRVPADEAFNFFQIAATANASLGRVEAARAAAAKALQYARPGREEAYARDLIHRLEDFAARRTAVARAMRGDTSPPPEASPPGTSGPAPDSRGAGTTDFQSTVQGRITNLECGTATAVMVVVTQAGDTLRLLVDNPAAVRLQGAPGPTADLGCGPQDRKVRVGYVPRVDAARKVVGLVRVLEFMP